MNKKRIIIALCLMVSASCALAFAWQQKTASLTPHRNAAIPPSVLYRQMFHHIALLKQKAEEQESKGQDGSSLRTLYKHSAKLTDNQAKALDEIASDCESKIAKLDKRAKQIQDEFRALHPGGKLNPSEQPPQPPAELKGLQAEREAVILQSRDRLHAAFGEEGFQQLEQFVQRNIADNTKPLRLDLPRPALPASSRQQAPHSQPVH